MPLNLGCHPLNSYLFDSTTVCRRCLQISNGNGILYWYDQNDERQANNTQTEIPDERNICEVCQKKGRLLWSEQDHGSAKGCVWHEESCRTANVHLRTHHEEWASCKSTLSPTPQNENDKELIIKTPGFCLGPLSSYRIVFPSRAVA